MGFLDALFGSGSAYSSTPKQLPSDTLKRLVNGSTINTLSDADTQVIREALLHARTNGAISLKKIDIVLRRLVSSHMISVYDKQGVLRILEEYMASDNSV